MPKTRSGTVPLFAKRNGDCRFWFAFVAGLTVMCVALTRPETLHGAGPALAFVRGLQDRGYPDVAVEYLKALQERGSLPPDLAEVFDLEMCRSLRGAANYAFDAKEAEQWRADARKHLDKFLKEKPDHPDAPSATLSAGQFLMDDALAHLRLAHGMTDKAQQAQRAKHLEAARAALEQAQPRFQEAMGQFPAQAAAILAASGTSKRPASRAAKAEAARQAQLELDWLDARFRIGLADYYIAQTYANPKDEGRVKALKNAASLFDDIYQANRLDARGQVSKIGLTAHMWHGKAAEEWGDLRLAEDIYDEVLANAESGVGQAQTGMEPLFAQVAYFRVLIYKKKAPPDDFVAEAREWLRAYRNFVKEDGYQGIALETAKSLLGLAEKAPAAEKRKLTTEAKDILTAMQKYPGEFQREAILLLRSLSKAGAADLSAVATFDEAAALGNAAAQAEQWTDAMTAYARAIEIARTAKVGIPKPERVAEAQEALARCQFMVARDLANKEKYQEALELAGAVVRQNKESPIAPAASELGVKAAFGLYLGAAQENKESARERLVKIAEYTIQNWPGKPEADGVRILLGQLSVSTGKVEEALKTFESVNPKSDRYPVALHMAGHTYWVRYLLAKSGQAKADKAQREADRQRAFERITQSLELQRKTLEKGKPMPPQMIETQLALADIYAERGDAQQAVALYQPLVEAVQAAKPESFDLTTMRIFVGAVKAHIAVNDIDKASQAGMVLAELGSDVPQVNAALVDFARLIDGERRRAEQTAAKPTADPKEVEAAKARMPGLRDVLGKLMKTLAGREQHTPAHLLYIAETSADVGLTDEARGLYEKFLDRLQNDTAFAEQGKRYETRARTQLVGLLRREGKPEEAMTQVEQLIKAHPNVLEPLKEKGLILMAWAEKDPAMYDKAVAHWAGLRQQLQGSRSPAVRAQYYEVVYHLAACLVNQAAGMSDKKAAAEKAQQAEHLLKATITLSPTLGGRTTLAGDYGVLIDKAAALQGRTPEAK